ncbi:MAG: kelch motif-containing protein [Fibrobacterota bacterium]|nr:kelch motif-containing protein [Fibrobacterota bacterium]
MWSQVGTNTLADVVPSPAVSGSNPVVTIMSAWSGGAFDTVGNRLLVFGGGHADSADNSVYAFSLSTSAWTRLSSPPSNAVIAAFTEATGYYPTDTGGATPDTQQPIARHTYNHLQWLPNQSKMMSACRLASYNNAGGGAQLDMFNPATALWSQGLAHNAGALLDEYSMSCVDASGNFWLYGGSNASSILTMYNPSANTWTGHGDGSNHGGAFSGTQYGTGVHDPVNNYMWGIGGGLIGYWDLAVSGNITFTAVTSSGVSTLQSAKYPGLAWDPVKLRIVGWSGGASVYGFNVTTREWTAISIDPSNTVTPTSAQAEGTYGRFRYASADGVFVCVNTTSGSVYKLSLRDA